MIKKRVKSKAGLREAKLLVDINHPNLIKVLGTSTNDNAFILVMPHLTGGSLQDRLYRPYSGDRFIDTALQLCRGMQAAHDKDILYGNLRPSNILFDTKERIRISDFGFVEHYRDGTWFLVRLWRRIGFKRSRTQFSPVGFFAMVARWPHHPIGI